ncbi:MAG: InlB B-repeat-containing protein, partial [Bacteroidaceae bacterium]|nr:InlB B-repeat-containing protein [Bacteroidaceae bacterium]
TIEPVFVFDQHFTVRGTVSPTGAGTVNGGGSYRPGQIIELEAAPNSGWRFDHWEDDAENTEAERSVTVQGDVNLTAVFTRIQSSYQCYLGVNNEDYGRVEPDTGYVTYDHGEEAEIEAVPYRGYEFVRWSDGRTENPRTIVAVKQIELTAIFHSVETEEFWMEERRCSIQGNGTELHYGDEIEVTVVPDNGFHFVGWSDDMSNTNPVRRFLFTEDFDWDIYPVCESDQTYTLDVYADPEEGGTITVTPLKEEYHMDDRVELVATPNPGWRFAGWHSRYWSSSSRETDIDIYRDTTIQARFEQLEPEGE